MEAKEIAEKIGRTTKSVEAMCERHGIKLRELRAWTEEEDEVLRQNGSKLTCARIGKLVKRSARAVAERGRELGVDLQKRGHRHHCATHPLKLRKKYAALRANGTAQQTAAKIVGVHPATARKWGAKEDQIKRTVVVKKYAFEGAEYSAPQVHKMMPAYSEKAIRSYLAEGATTKADIHRIANQRKLNSAAQARKNAIAGGLTNNNFFVKKGK
jgi:transposase